MKYLIIGAGGTGGTVGFYLTLAGRDVTLAARGEHLRVMQEKGLTMSRPWCHTRQTIAVKTLDTEAVSAAAGQNAACAESVAGGAQQDAPSGTPDVILVCVKGYSLDSVVPLIRQTAGPSTIVIPILNIYGTGEKLQEKLPELTVLDGCIYVAANIREPGTLVQNGEILRVIFGLRDESTASPEQMARLEEIQEDMRACGIDGCFSHHVRRDCLKKFSYVSPAGAAGLFYDATAGDFQKAGPQREMLIAMMREITALADAMGCGFDEDCVKKNLDIMSKLDPASGTSMQRNIAAGRPSEIDGLVYEVVRMGERFGVSVPTYQAAATLLKKKYGEG